MFFHPLLYKFTIGIPYSFFICLRVSSPKYFIIELSCRHFRMKNETGKFKMEKRKEKWEIKNEQFSTENEKWKLVYQK
jgi:hypothetical protein